MFSSRILETPSRKEGARLIAVRRMSPEDISGTAALFQEMQAHYRVACPPRDEITASLARLPEGVSVLIAADPSVIGFAAVGAIFPGPGLKPGLFLKELFVSAGARGSGAGTALMQAVAQLAVECGFARLDWTADRSDARLLSFYNAVGAIQQSEKVFFRLTNQALTRLAAARLGGSSAKDAN